MKIFLKDGAEKALVARMRVPEPLENRTSGWHDMYVGYDPATGQDKFYGGGSGGYYVLDISRLEDIKLLASITGVSGVRWGHTFTPTPDGRYAVGETEYQYAPLRIYNLKPALNQRFVPATSRPRYRLPITEYRIPNGELPRPAYGLRGGPRAGVGGPRGGGQGEER